MVHTGIEPTASALLAPWAQQLSFANYTQSPSCLPVFGNAFQEGLLHHLSRNRGEADWLVVPWIFFFALLVDRSDICFLPAVRMSLHNHALSKKITSGLKVMLPSSFTTHGCFISGLCLKWPLCQSVPLKVYFLLPSFPLVSEAHSPCRLLFRVLHHWGACPSWSWVHVFLSFPVATDTSVEASLIALHISCHIGLHVGFGFPYPFSVCLDNTSIFLLNYLSLLSSHSTSQWPELLLNI